MKIVFMLLAVGLFFIKANAQTKEKNWDARFAIGGGTYPFLQDGGRFLRFDIFHPEVTGTAYNAGVFYTLKNKHLKLGLAIAYDGVKEYYVEIFIFSGSTQPPYLIAKQHTVAIMPSVNYNYLLKKHSQLYSELCFGPAFTKKKLYEKNITQHSVDAGFQCTVIGYRFGNQVQAYAELGYGYKGILQVGASYSF